MSFEDQCRTCLGMKKEMRHYQTIISISGEDVQLSHILDNFYNYKILEDDQLPKNICINCVYHLTVTYSFKILIENSTKTLQDSLNIEESKSDYYDSNLDLEDYKPDKDDDSTSQEYKINDNIAYYNSKKFRKSMFSRDSENPNEVFCVECKAKFGSVESLSEHCINNHPAKLVTGIADCNYCNEKFEDFKTLQKHIKLHLRPYLCEACWDGFYTINEMNAHNCPMSYFDKPERVLQQCDQCGKSYPPGYIKIHLRTHGNDYRYACKLCPKRFKVPCSLNSHVLWNHTKTRNHRCDICNAMFVSASQRSTHNRIHHLNERNHACDTCGKKFFSKSDVRRHALKHTGDKKFHCDLCDKSFQRKYGLNVHLKSHAQVNAHIKSEKSDNLGPK